MVVNISRVIKAGLMLTGLTALVPFLSGCSESQAVVADEVVRPVKLMQVKHSDSGELRSFPARVFASEESRISFRIPGELIALPVQPAQQVKKGELLARLDERDLKNAVDLKQASYDLAELNFQRIKALREQKVVPQAKLDAARANLKASLAALRLAGDRLQYATLTAPFDGRIAQTTVEKHQFVQAKETILVLQDSRSLDIKFQLPGTVLQRLQGQLLGRGYHPAIIFDGVPGRTFPATYKSHATSVTRGTQSYEVTLTLPVPEGVTVYPGMGATVRVDLSQLLPGTDDMSDVVVPLTAVLADDASGARQVWVFDQNSGAVHPVNVTTGRISQSGIYVLSGLNGDEQIVVAGLSQLVDGQIVKPLVRERGL